MNLLLLLLFLLAVFALKAPGLSPLFCSEPQQHQALLPAFGLPRIEFLPPPSVSNLQPNANECPIHSRIRF